MKNIINKIVIIMLIFAFIMPEFVVAKVNRNALFSSAKQKYKTQFPSDDSVETVNKNTRATLPTTKTTTPTDEKTNTTVNNTTTASNNKKEYKLPEEKITKLNSLIADVNNAKENVVTMCGSISNDLSKIKGLGITTSITSAIGTGFAASALATGKMKTQKQKERQEAERKRKIAEEKAEAERKRKEEEAKKKAAEEEKKEGEKGKKGDEKEPVADKEIVEENEVTEENEKDDDKKAEEKKEEEKTPKKEEKKIEDSKFCKQNTNPSFTSWIDTEKDICSLFFDDKGNFLNKKYERCAEGQERLYIDGKWYDITISDLNRNFGTSYNVMGYEYASNMSQYLKNNCGKIIKENNPPAENEEEIVTLPPPENDDVAEKKRKELNRKIVNFIENEYSVFLEESYNNSDQFVNYKDFLANKDSIIENFNLNTSNIYIDDKGTEYITVYTNEYIWNIEKKQVEKFKKELGISSYIPQPLQDKYINNFGFKTYFAVLTPEQKFGHIRTGLMAGAAVTSGISVGTSGGGAATAGKLYEKMQNCNNAVTKLKTANSILIKEIWDIDTELKANDIHDSDYLAVANKTNKTAKNIVKSCKKYETQDIVTVKNILTGSSVISAIGTATAVTGTITSALANSKKTEKDSEKQNKLDLTSNIMAGVTTGTSATTMVLTATSAAKLGKKLMEQVTKCEESFNE